MGRGRRPKPTALKLLAGAQPCRVNAAEPDPGAGRPEPPDHLDGDARAEWDRVADALAAMGVLTPADGPALAIYCVAFARWLVARAEVDARGLVIDTALGGVKANPATAVAAACERTMAAVLGSFGLTPADRSRVKARADAKRDDLTDFIARRNA